MKISQELSAKYYQDKKERLHKRLMEVITVFPTKQKKNSNNMCVNNMFSIVCSIKHV